MLEDKRLGLTLIIIGVLANNFVYLNDLIFAKQPELAPEVTCCVIFFGWLAMIGAVVAVVVIASGVVILLRSQASDAAE